MTTYRLPRLTPVKVVMGEAGQGLQIGEGPGTTIFPLEPEHLAARLAGIIAALESQAYDAGVKDAQKKMRAAMGLSTNTRTLR